MITNWHAVCSRGLLGATRSVEGGVKVALVITFRMMLNSVRTKSLLYHGEVPIALTLTQRRRLSDLVSISLCSLLEELKDNWF